MHIDSPEKVLLFENQTIKMTSENGKAVLDRAETNQFCREWAEKMINLWKEIKDSRQRKSANDNLDPSSIILRKVLESFKLKVIFINFFLIS